MQHVVIAQCISQGERLAFTSHSGQGDRLVGHVGWSEVEIAGDDVGLLSLEHELEALVVTVEEGYVLGISRTIFHLQVVSHIALDDSLLYSSTLGVEC